MPRERSPRAATSETRPAREWSIRGSKRGLLSRTPSSSSVLGAEPQRACQLPRDFVQHVGSVAEDFARAMGAEPPLHLFNLWRPKSALVNNHMADPGGADDLPGEVAAATWVGQGQ